MVLQLVKDMIYVFVKRVFILLLLVVPFLGFFDVVNAQNYVTEDIYTVFDNQATWNFNAPVSFRIQPQNLDNYYGVEITRMWYAVSEPFVSFYGTEMAFVCSDDSQIVNVPIEPTGVFFDTGGSANDQYEYYNLDLRVLERSCSEYVFQYPNTPINFAIAGQGQPFPAPLTNYVYHTDVNFINPPTTFFSGGPSLVPPPAVPLSFSLLASTTEPTDLVASVISGVQTTGQSIWPLFGFVGVSLAFIIALQVVVFTRRAVMRRKGQI